MAPSTSQIEVPGCWSPSSSATALVNSKRDKPTGLYLSTIKELKMKNFVISGLCLAVLTACGGGGGDDNNTQPIAAPAPAPSPAPSPAPTPTPTPAPAPASTASTEPALPLAKAFFASYDASLATSIPASGATALALNDGCSLNNGTSKALGVSDYDADPLRVASRQFDIGSTRSDVTVTSERTIINPDNTVRREIDVKYVVNYLDGTKNESATQTLITGSSAGSTLANGSACTTPQDTAGVRFLGNKRIANTFVTAWNEKNERFLLASGLANTPAVTYNRYISLNVRDPARIATYATISGPGLISASGAPATFKLISPRLLRDDPLFAGKNGNFVDWRDIDSFRVCRTSTGSFATAEIADCVTNGANSTFWGSFNSTDPAAQDAAFDALGVTAGGVYTVNLYSGTGWKTVNGQAGETPIASYTTVLENLPMSTVALAGTVAAPANKYPEFLTSSLTSPDIATNLRNKVGFSTDLTWAAPKALINGKTASLTTLYTFEQGRATAGPAFNPASRQYTPSFPASTALSATLNVPAPVPALVAPTYIEATLEYSNRNGSSIKTIRAFQ